ncbi:MAG: hypothetical protein M1826_007675 [Phylliscum demangeonii]|nr:MAG: hypothetical protein M1826_007675 [Phylliscum demangeonii]
MEDMARVGTAPTSRSASYEYFRSATAGTPARWITSKIEEQQACSNDVAVKQV